MLPKRKATTVKLCDFECYQIYIGMHSFSYLSYIISVWASAFSVSTIASTVCSIDSRKSF